MPGEQDEIELGWYLVWRAATFSVYRAGKHRLRCKAFATLCGSPGFSR
jgi:hypothetical protein